MGDDRQHQATFLMNALRGLTWCCAVLLGVLSLLPGEDMVRTGAPGQFEHFVAYDAKGAIAMGGYGLSHGRARIIRGCWVYAGLLEFHQHFYPGSHTAFVVLTTTATR